MWFNNQRFDKRMRELQASLRYLQEYETYTLRKKHPYSKLFSPNAGKYRPE